MELKHRNKIYFVCLFPFDIFNVYTFIQQDIPGGRERFVNMITIAGSERVKISLKSFLTILVIGKVRSIIHCISSYYLLHQPLNTSYWLTIMRDAFIGHLKAQK